jgi:hypothetical protein
MLNLTIVCTVDFCARHARLVVLAAAVVAFASGIYAARHFSATANGTTAPKPGVTTHLNSRNAATAKERGPKVNTFRF